MKIMLASDLRLMENGLLQIKSFLWWENYYPYCDISDALKTIPIMSLLSFSQDRAFHNLKLTPAQTETYDLIDKLISKFLTNKGYGKKIKKGG